MNIRNENPSPAGPQGEPVGEKDSATSERKPGSNKELEPIPGPGAPMVPDHQSIDSNPIDPRVF